MTVTDVSGVLVGQEGIKSICNTLNPYLDFSIHGSIKEIYTFLADRERAHKL